MDERRQSSLDGTHARPAWRIEPMSSAVLVTVGTEIDLAAVPLFTQVLDAGRTLLVLPATMERVLSKIEAERLSSALLDQFGQGHLQGPSRATCS